MAIKAFICTVSTKTFETFNYFYVFNILKSCVGIKLHYLLFLMHHINRLYIFSVSIILLHVVHYIFLCPKNDKRSIVHVDF